MANSAHSDIHTEYIVSTHHIILSPGKFEGEGCYTPYLYHKMLDGGFNHIYPCQEYPDGLSYTLILPEDRELFPNLPIATYIGIFEDDQGFVGCIFLDEEPVQGEDIEDMED